ncbi:hypothetical protein FRC02_003707 [Tulasnella sp. 418]|nr:hypothetical protein FRC02_003707 [Tulasnella sp. 418]
MAKSSSKSKASAPTTTKSGCKIMVAKKGHAAEAELAQQERRLVKMKGQRTKQLHNRGPIGSISPSSRPGPTLRQTSMLRAFLSPASTPQPELLTPQLLPPTALPLTSNVPGSKPAQPRPYQPLFDEVNDASAEDDKDEDNSDNDDSEYNDDNIDENEDEDVGNRGNDDRDDEGTTSKGAIRFNIPGDAELLGNKDDDEDDNNHDNEGDNDSEDGDDDSSATSSLKRKRISDQAPHNSQNSKPHPKVSDYPPKIQAILNLGTSICRVLVATKDPFPTTEDQFQITQQALTKAIEEEGIDDIEWECNSTHIKIVQRGITQMRGQLKDAARMFVRSSYALANQLTKVRGTRKLYLKLVEDDAYIHEDIALKKGRWYHPILMEVIRVVFFAKRNPEALKFREYFEPIPAPLIALTATAVRVALNEYKTGKFTKEEF